MFAAGFLVAGGFLGSSARLTAQKLGCACLGDDYPYHAIVNFIGSFLVGALAGWLAIGGSEAWRPFLAAGLIAGFLASSVFKREALQLWQGGAAALALADVVGTLIVGLLCIGIGARLIFLL